MFVKFILLSFFLLICGLGGATLVHYPGSWQTYLLFTVVSQALLLNGFRKRAIFFDTFIGVLLWLGFWFSFSVRVSQGIKMFPDIPNWDNTAESFHHVLIISCCGLVGFLLASKLREKYFVYPRSDLKQDTSAIFLFYQRHRLWVLIVFVALVIGVAVSNVILGAYQRGMIPAVQLPGWVVGIYSWLLLFGLSSMVAIIVRCEIQLRQSVSWVSIALTLIESFLSSVAMLSRGMVINFTAIAAGTWLVSLNRSLKITVKRALAIGVLFCTVFIISIFVVNHLRSIVYSTSSASVATVLRTSGALSVDWGTVRSFTVPLFVDRWVGIDGVAAIASASGLGWDLWSAAWKERRDTTKLTEYDEKFISSAYSSNEQISTRHFISLPGLIAFSYLTGSLLFVLFFSLICGLVASTIEITTYFFAGKNLILCSLLGQVVAYRYTHFGYAPAQSYLLFGTIALNIALIYLLEKLLQRMFVNKRIKKAV
jgi:hypothetical protein